MAQDAAIDLLVVGIVGDVEGDFAPRGLGLGSAFGEGGATFRGNLQPGLGQALRQTHALGVQNNLSHVRFSPELRA